VRSFQEAVKKVKGAFTCVPWVRSAERPPNISPTGEPYFVLRVDGETEEIAAKKWLAQISRRRSGRSTIYWRIEPELEEYPNRYVIYSRLVFA